MERVSQRTIGRGICKSRGTKATTQYRIPVIPQTTRLSDICLPHFLSPSVHGRIAHTTNMPHLESSSLEEPEKALKNPSHWTRSIPSFTPKVWTRFSRRTPSNHPQYVALSEFLRSPLFWPRNDHRFQGLWRPKCSLRRWMVPCAHWYQSISQSCRNWKRCNMQTRILLPLQWSTPPVFHPCCSDISFNNGSPCQKFGTIWNILSIVLPTTSHVEDFPSFLRLLHQVGWKISYPPYLLSVFQVLSLKDIQFYLNHLKFHLIMRSMESREENS